MKRISWRRVWIDFKIHALGDQPMCWSGDVELCCKRKIRQLVEKELRSRRAAKKG